MFSLRNITAHSQSTKAGALAGALQVAVLAAAKQFMTTGNISDPTPYYVAAISAAAPVIVGALYAPAAAASTPASEVTGGDPLADHKAEILSGVDKALTAAAQQAMTEAAAKLAPKEGV